MSLGEMPPPSGCFPFEVSVRIAHPGSSCSATLHLSASPGVSTGAKIRCPRDTFPSLRRPVSQLILESLFCGSLTLFCVFTSDISQCVDLLWPKLTWEQLHCTPLLQYGFFRHRWRRRTGKRAGKVFRSPPPPESDNFPSRWGVLSLALFCCVDSCSVCEHKLRSGGKLYCKFNAVLSLKCVFHCQNKYK